MSTTQNKISNSLLSYAEESSSKAINQASLEACLDSKTKKLLLDIAKEYDVPKASSLKKDELVSLLKKQIISSLGEKLEGNPKLSQKLGEVFGEEEIVPISKGKAIDEEALRLGLIYSYKDGEELVLAIPNEIKSFILSSKEEYDRDNFRKFVSGIINLYGAFSLNSLIMTYCSETGESISPASAEKEIKALKTISIKNSFIFDKKFGKEEKKSLEKILDNLKKGSFYKPSFSEIMKHSDESYYDESAELIHLKKFATQYVTGNKAMTDKIIGEIVLAHRRCTAYSIEQYTSLFSQNGYGFRNISIESKIVTLLSYALGTIRMWVYGGYTTLEEKKIKLSEMSKENKLRSRLPFVSEKIGRNDPCPCGSGLKYKKCCGKNA